MTAVVLLSLLGRKGLHNFGLTLGAGLVVSAFSLAGEVIWPKAAAARTGGPVAGAQGMAQEMAQGMAALAPERSIRPMPRPTGVGLLTRTIEVAAVGPIQTALITTTCAPPFGQLPTRMAGPRRRCSSTPLICTGAPPRLRMPRPVA